MTTATKYSLWLEPDPDTRARLQPLMATLAERLASPLFAPHITLCSPLHGDPEDLAMYCSQLATQTGAIHVTPLSIDHGVSYYRSLYITLDADAPLKALHASACEHFQVPVLSSYFPHISLVYAPPDTLDDETRAMSLVGDLAKPLRFHQITLLDTSGDLHTWRCLARKVLCE